MQLDWTVDRRSAIRCLHPFATRRVSRYIHQILKTLQVPTVYMHRARELQIDAAYSRVTYTCFFVTFCPFVKSVYENDTTGFGEM